MTDPSIGQLLIRTAVAAFRGTQPQPNPVASLRVPPRLLAISSNARLIAAELVAPQSQIGTSEAHPVGLLAEIILSQTVTVIVAALVVAAVLH